MKDEWGRRAKGRLRSARTLIWLLAAVGLLGMAWLLIDRVRHRRLFLLALWLDRPATETELLDARASADYYLLPALGCIAAITLVVDWATRRGVAASLRLFWVQIRRLLAHHPVLVWAFAVATAADLATTLWFFHARGIELELHPGIRLVGYAFGRTSGPLMGKGVQFVGIFVVAALLPRIAPVILVVATITYFLAVVYNIGLM